MGCLFLIAIYLLFCIYMDDLKGGNIYLLLKILLFYIVQMTGQNTAGKLKNVCDGFVTYSNGEMSLNFNYKS